MSDDELRVMLHERAASIPDAPERLVDLNRRIRRDRRRRSMVIVGGTVAALAVAATLVVPRLTSDPSRVDPADRVPAASAAPAACPRVDISSAASESGVGQLTRAWTATTSSAGRVPSWAPVPAGSIPPHDRTGLDASSAVTVDVEAVVRGLYAYGVSFAMDEIPDTPPNSVGDAGHYVYYSGVRLGDVSFTGVCEPSAERVTGTLRVYTTTGGGLLQCSQTLPTEAEPGSWAVLAARFCPAGSPATR